MGIELAMGPKFNLTNQRFGRLLVLAYLESNDRRESMWECICDCGTKRLASSTHLRRSEVQSCGCLGKEARRTNRLTHGRTKTPEYYTWQGMRNRCRYPSNKKYSDYGGRGITYAPQWESFEIFFGDVGLRPSPNHTLDRYPNNDGNYEPGNIRWATKKEQAANTRRKRIEQFSDQDLMNEVKRRGLQTFTSSL